MATIEVKNFEKDADEVSTPNNARVETVNISGQRVMKLTIQPGWKWSDDIKPLVGTDSCKAKHLGVIVEGSITCRHDDGTQVTYSAGRYGSAQRKRNSVCGWQRREIRTCRKGNYSCDRV